MSDEIWLVVGLGNPGPSYAATRHNIGYMVNDELASRLGGSWKHLRAGRSDVVEGRLKIGGPRIVLCRPRSFMNEVGGPVKSVAQFYKIPADHVIGIHDELDIDFDTMRVKFGGGDNGHNGLKSMRSSLATGDFFRLRVGIGRPQGRQDVADFVLAPYSTAERKVLPFQVDTAADAIEMLTTEGLERTQSRFNS